MKTMNIVAAIVFILIAIVLFVLWRKGKISNPTLNAIDKIATVISVIIALVILICPDWKCIPRFTPRCDNRTRPADGMVMIFIPAGEFLMGSSAIDDVDALANEKPQHTVYLDDYWIDKTEVTNAQYALCVAEGKCQPPSNSSSYSRSSYYGVSQYDDYPVINVSWHDAVAYCNWVGGRLPTEAEWEKAARGADGRIYPWGNQHPTCQLTNNESCVGDTNAVGSYPDGASPCGLSDMAGNVWEWVQDWYDETYYASSPTSNPPGPASGEYRVLRGGSWDDIRNNVRSATRISDLPGNSYYGFGFRCVISP